MKQAPYPLMEIARIGALFLVGDQLEDVMPADRREYPLRVVNATSVFALGDEVDFDEHNFNELKKTLLRIERIDPRRSPFAALWVRRPEQPTHGEVMVAGSSLPAEGYHIQPLWPEIERAFSGLPTRWDSEGGTTIYYPIRNSDEEIVGVLEVSEQQSLYFI